MPTLASPLYLLAAAFASAVVIALHLLAWRRPTPHALPTARFVPPSAVRAVSRAIRPTDLLLLLVRVLALLLAGLALARPVVASARAGAARVILMDASRRVASIAAVADSARVHAAGADAVAWVRVDSAARTLADSATGERSDVRGNLSAGLVVALREALRLERTHARVDLVVISPFAAESWDPATERIRDEWEGRVTPVRVAMRNAMRDSGAAPARASRLAAVLPSHDDPIGAAFAVALDDSSAVPRVTRDVLTAQDSAWARAGGVLVRWPRAIGADDERAGPPIAIVGDDVHSVAGHFARIDSVPLPGQAILRWSTGAVAAAEIPLSAGCLRTVAIDVPASGDETLRPGFRHLVRALLAPCGGGSSAVVDDVTLARWAAGAHDGASQVAQGAMSPASSRAPRRAISREEGAPTSPLPTRALLAGVALLLLLEWWLRRTGVAPSVARATIHPPGREEGA
jgi:hypothetical protein